MSYLYNKRMMKEKKLLQLSIEKGEVVCAEWSEDGERLKTTHFAGDLFGEVEAEFMFPPTYLLKPPTLTVKSTVVHPNIYSHRHPISDMRGRVCMTILDIQAETGNQKTDHWTPAFDVTNILKALTVVLNNPGVDSPANVDANKLYLGNREEYNEKNMKLKDIREFRKVRAVQDKDFEEALLKDKEVQANIQKEDSRGVADMPVKSEQAENVDPVSTDDLLGDGTRLRQRIRTKGGQEMFEFTSGEGIATVQHLKAALEIKRKSVVSLRTMDGPISYGEPIEKYQKTTIYVDEDSD